MISDNVYNIVKLLNMYNNILIILGRYTAVDI